jgi:hypothetical protein
MAWYDSLEQNPHEAFPTLINSYKYDPCHQVERYFPGAQAEFEAMRFELARLKGEEGYRQWRQHVSNLYRDYKARDQQQWQQYNQAVQRGVHQRLQPYVTQAQHDNWRRTHDYLNQWAADKPHFAKVRQKMGFLLSPDPQTGQAVVGLGDGKIDLDEAYNQAIWMDPQIRKQLIAEQQRAARAQREEQQRRLNAGSSISSSSPGSFTGRQKANGASGKSVRDSLYEAIDQLRGAT